MRTVFTIAHNDLYMFLRNRRNYISLFGVPLLFVFFYAIMNRDSNPDSVKNPRPFLLVENQDKGEFGDLLIAEIQRQLIAPIKAGDEGEKQAGKRIVIPAHFTESLKKLEPIDLPLYATGGGSIETNEIVSSRLMRATTRLSSNVFKAASINESTGVDAEQLVRLAQRSDPVQINAGFAGKASVPTGFAQALPGVLVMFLLMNLLSVGGASITEDREKGVMQRLAVYPLSKMELVLGKIYGRWLLGIATIVFFLLMGEFAFKVKVEGSGLALLVILLIFTWGCAGLGVLLGAVVTNQAKVASLSLMIGLVASAMGGCWWPMEIVPDHLKLIGHVFPTAWAMDGLTKIIHLGFGWEALHWELAVLSGFAIVSTTMAAKFLRY